MQVTFNFDVVPLEKILLGELNWEVTHVGYESRVHINGDYHIGSLIRYLTMYGYFYQNKIIKALYVNKLLTASKPRYSSKFLIKS